MDRARREAPGESDEDRAKAGLLRTFVYGTVPLTLLFTAVYVQLRPDLLFRTCAQSAVFCSLGLAALGLIRRGRVQLAVRAMAIAFWCVVAYSVYTAGGVQAPAFPAFAAIILMTGVLWSSRAAFVMTALSMAYGALLVALEQRGTLPRSVVEDPAMGRFVAGCLIFGTVATLQYLAARIARESLAHARAENEHRKRAEQRSEQTQHDLETSEQRYRSIFESAAVALFEVDFEGVRAFAMQEGRKLPGQSLRSRLQAEPALAAELTSRVRVLDANAAGLRVVDLETKDALLGPLTPRVAPENQARAAEFCLSLVEGHDTVQHELSIVSFSGRPKQVLLGGRAPARADQVDRVVVSVVDVTEQRRHEARNRTAQRLEAIGRLSGGVAHDFNNALVVIISWISLLRRPGRTEQERADGLLAIEKSAERAVQLTRQLMSLGRRTVRAPRPTEVGAVVDETVRAISRLLPADIEISVDHKCELLALTDEAGLQQVLLNLALNARDAMPQGGKLELLTRSAKASEVVDLTGRGEYVVITVRDSGTGMDAATRSRLFEPFFTTKPEGRGTGLGLATAHAIVVESRGKIVVQSELGVGTSFSVYLPAAEGVAQTLAAVAEPVWTGEGRVVLVVEDEPMVREVLEESLRGAGYAVLSAGEGAAALALARKHLAEQDAPIALLCTDGIMPGMPTRDLITSFSLLYPDAPVLVCSGHLEEELMRRGIERGDWSFLGKPFSPDVFLRKVDELLRRA